VGIDKEHTDFLKNMLWWYLVKYVKHATTIFAVGFTLNGWVLVLKAESLLILLCNQKAVYKGQ